MKYEVVACGGTFDSFHKGHKDFFAEIFKSAEKVVIGITSDEFVSSYKSADIEPFKDRKEAVESFVSPKFSSKFEIVKINDIFGPLLEKDFHADALAAPEEVVHVAENINVKRKEFGLPVLETIVIPMTRAEDSEPISSSRIRNGEIDKDGKLWVRPEWRDLVLKLTDELREELKKPLGELSQEIPKTKKLITVGDVVTKKANELGLGQKISIVDFKVERERTHTKISELGFDGSEQVHEIVNESGTIHGGVFEVLESAFVSDKRSVILVDGEEDLLALPAILVAPLGYTVIYGQPGEGIVRVEVTEKAKKHAQDVLSKFAK